MDQTAGFANKDIWSASGQIVSCAEHCHVLLSAIGPRKYLGCQNVTKFFMCLTILERNFTMEFRPMNIKKFNGSMSLLAKKLPVKSLCLLPLA